MKRPGSLQEVADRAVTARDFRYALAELLDQFAIERLASMLAAEPARLAERIEDGDIADAYLAAVAVELARSVAAVPPAWVLHPSRVLRRPWFAHPGAALRATLLLESPAGFRERNLFVSANALSRA